MSPINEKELEDGYEDDDLLGDESESEFDDPEELDEDENDFDDED
jgi:hypothetical protein